MIQYTKHDVTLPGLPAAASGMRLVQLTDLHRSSFTRESLLHESVQLASKAAADLIVLTGDYVSDKEHDIEPVAKLLSPLRAPLGVYAILGNHDHHTSGAKVTHALEKQGIVVLRNQSVQLSNGVWLVGLDDDRYKHTDVARSFKGVPEAEPVIVLAHNPALVERFSERNCLTLSGHTHGGQIHLPILTARELRRIGAKHYRHGWYHVGAAQMYVCRGLGNVGLPIRMFCNPEVAEFKLLP